MAVMTTLGQTRRFPDVRRMSGVPLSSDVSGAGRASNLGRKRTSLLSGNDGLDRTGHFSAGLSGGPHDEDQQGRMRFEKVWYYRLPLSQVPNGD
jgi:hypothetical protein